MPNEKEERRPRGGGLGQKRAPDALPWRTVTTHERWVRISEKFKNEKTGTVGLPGVTGYYIVEIKC